MSECMFLYMKILSLFLDGARMSAKTPMSGYDTVPAPEIVPNGRYLGNM